MSGPARKNARDRTPRALHSFFYSPIELTLGLCPFSLALLRAGLVGGADAVTFFLPVTIYYHIHPEMSTPFSKKLFSIFLLTNRPAYGILSMFQGNRRRKEKCFSTS